MTSTPAMQPTRARHWVIVFAVTLAVITYFDRVCISQSANNIQRDLGFTKEQMRLAFSAFTLAYAIFEIPAGWLATARTARGADAGCRSLVILYRCGHGLAWNLVDIVCRFLFGAAKLGCFPNLTKIFTIWLPWDERVRAQGIMWLSARWGGAFTPLIVLWVMKVLTWRQAFLLFGSSGMVWAVVFYFWFRDHPRDHRSVNAAELTLLDGAEVNTAGHGNVPWKKFLHTRSVWLLWLQYFCMCYGWYFYITWLPTYLKEARGVQLAKGAFLSGLPLFFGGLACLFVGVLIRRLARWTGSVRHARRIPALLGLVVAAIMLVLSARIENATLAMIALGLAGFANDCAMPSGWGGLWRTSRRQSRVRSPGAGEHDGEPRRRGRLLVVAQILKFTATSDDLLLGRRGNLPGRRRLLAFHRPRHAAGWKLARSELAAS